MDARPLQPSHIRQFLKGPLLIAIELKLSFSIFLEIFNQSSIQQFIWKYRMRFHKFETE